MLGKLRRLSQNIFEQMYLSILPLALPHRPPNDPMTDLTDLLSQYLGAWAWPLATALTGLIVAPVALRAADHVLRTLAGPRILATALLRRALPPAHWFAMLLMLQGVWAATPEGLAGLDSLRHLTLLGIILAATWLAFRAIQGVRDGLFALYPATQVDDLRDRQIRTQTVVLARSLMGLVLVLGASAALITFPSVRTLGASLLASAGVAGLTVGLAARPVLSNLLAGLQIALAQPIRLGDVVVVEGEWGNIEEITAAFVVVRIWDQRRLILPLNWFIEHSFQNWTRTSAEIIGAVFLWVDYHLPLEPLRSELSRLCRAAPEWDGRACLLQVTEAGQQSMQLRALVSSASSSANWDLRCKVREGLTTFVANEYPDFLPKARAELLPPI